MLHVSVDDKTFMHRISLTAEWGGLPVASIRHNAVDLVKRNLVFEEVLHRSWISFLPVEPARRKARVRDAERSIKDDLDILMNFFWDHLKEAGFLWHPAIEYTLELIGFLKQALERPESQLLCMS